MNDRSSNAQSANAPVAPTGERGDPVLQLATDFWASRCLHVVAELGVADHIDADVRSAVELANAVGANTDALNRVLRLLSSRGIFQARPGGYAHSDASRTLRSDHPQSRRPYVRFTGGRQNWNNWGVLEHCVRTGKPSAVAFGGSPAPSGEKPETRLFDEAMTARVHREVATVTAAYDFSSSATIADVGGGRGHLLRAILDVVPTARGVVFDLPHVVANVPTTDRMTAVGGDFFSGEPPPADTYLLMNVLHDWPDDASSTILAAIRRAAPAGARLLIIECIIPDGPEPHWSKALDINMLRIGGRERNQAEYASLLAAAGFHAGRIISTDSPYSIIEAIAV